MSLSAMQLHRYAPALLALWLASLPARADNTADEADVAFSVGNRAYARNDYEEALKNYFLSYRLVANRNVLFNIARCYEALDRFNEAYRYYDDLLALHLLAGDEREVVAALARIRPKVALIRIDSEPPGAEIFVDREDLGSRGRSPQTLALPPGSHLVKVGKAGFHPAQATVQLQRGKESSKRFKLELVVGEVAVAGTPAAAWVRDSADGPALARVPGTVRLPPGKHVLFVGAEGFVTAQSLVDVREGETARLEVALARQPLPTGKLILTANRENALIRVDGKDAGFTPTVLTLPAGEHLLEVSTAELRSWQRQVTVPREGEERIHAELLYEPPKVEAASKTLRSLDEAPASTTVITRDEIRAFGYRTLAEALRAVRGFFLTDDRQYSYLGIRGFSPPGDLNTRVLILYDGHAMNDLWAGQGYAGRELDVDLDEVDRIEVVRGPGSALYGTGAFFAVINVVPRDRLAPGRTVEVTGGVGALGAWQGHLAGSLGSAGTSVTASLSGFGAQGADVTDLGAGGLVRGLDGERAYDAAVRLRAGGFTLNAKLNSRVKDIPTAPFNTLVGAPGTREADTRGFVELRFDRELPMGAVSARAYYDGSRYRGHWVYPDASADTLTRTDTDAGVADWLGAEGRLRLNIFEGNQLSVGLEAQLQLRVEQQVRGAAVGSELESHTRSLLSAYALNEWRLNPSLTLSLGGRVDRYSDLDVVPISPRAAVILRPYEGGLTKLVAGSAFRAPNVYELYYEDFGLSQKPALKLSPESILTLELEHSHNLTEELRLTVAGYWNRISRLVVLGAEDAPSPGCGPPAGRVQCIIYRNTSDLVQAFGVEAELRWQPGRFALVDASYSFVGLLSRSADVSDMVVPVHLVSGRLLLPLGSSGVRLSTQAVYQSARDQADGLAPGTGEALLVNVGLSGDLGWLRYFAGVDNLLDVRYALPTGSSPEDGVMLVPQYGRTFLLRLTATY